MNPMLNLTQRVFGTRRNRCVPRPKLRVKGARVLVVDDNPDLRALYAAILDFEGYKVSLAIDGADALEQISAGTFDLILTDRQMPVVDGETLVVALRSAGIEIPIVMLSGSLPDRALRKFVAREIAFALPKATSTAAILAAVYLALTREAAVLAAAA
jgi:CheY-like chemotaxis protein